MFNQWEFNKAEFNKEWYENEERGKFKIVSSFQLSESGNMRIRPLRKGIKSIIYEIPSPRVIRHK